MYYFKLYFRGEGGWCKGNWFLIIDVGWLGYILLTETIQAFNGWIYQIIIWEFNSVKHDSVMLVNTPFERPLIPGGMNNDISPVYFFDDGYISWYREIWLLWRPQHMNCIIFIFIRLFSEPLCPMDMGGVSMEKSTLIWIEMLHHKLKAISQNNLYWLPGPLVSKETCEHKSWQHDFSLNFWICLL